MRRSGRTRRGLLVLAAFGVVVAVGAALAGPLAAPPGDGDARDAKRATSVETRGEGAASEADARAGADPRAFLDTYVDADGRVVRLDQGGDTVSEGQAYAMLIAADLGDEATFDRVWSWTRSTLRRPDGTLSWRWADGAVADPSPASDADLDAARALLVAADEFDDPALRADGVALGTAVMDHETVAVPDGRVLLAGSWTLDGNPDGPWAFNPSYVSPVTTSMLAEATGDPRWAALEVGSRAAVAALVDDTQLPPNWAQIDADGTVRPVAGPDGTPVQYGYDAARTVLRHAESCDPADRAIAAEAEAVLGDVPVVAVHDLAGSPLTDDRSPLASMAHAAAQAAAGDEDAAVAALRAATRAQQHEPTYYGDAWAALGPVLLTSDTLGGCPALAASRDPTR